MGILGPLDPSVPVPPSDLPLLPLVLGVLGVLSALDPPVLQAPSHVPTPTHPLSWASRVPWTP